MSCSYSKGPSKSPPAHGPAVRKQVPQERKPSARMSTRGRGAGTRSSRGRPVRRAALTRPWRQGAAPWAWPAGDEEARPRPGSSRRGPSARALDHALRCPAALPPRGPTASRTLPAGPGPARPWGPPPSAMGAPDLPRSAAPARARPADRKQGGSVHFRRRGQVGRVGGATSGGRAPPSRAYGAPRGVPARPPPASGPDVRPSEAGRELSGGAPCRGRAPAVRRFLHGSGGVWENKLTWGAEPNS